MAQHLLIYSIKAFMHHYYICLAPAFAFLPLHFSVLNPLTFPEVYKGDRDINHLLSEDTSAHCAYVHELHNMTQVEEAWQNKLIYAISLCKEFHTQNSILSPNVWVFLPNVIQESHAHRLTGKIRAHRKKNKCILVSGQLTPEG